MQDVLRAAVPRLLALTLSGFFEIRAWYCPVCVHRSSLCHLEIPLLLMHPVHGDSSALGMEMCGGALCPPAQGFEVDSRFLPLLRTTASRLSRDCSQ